MPGPLEGGEDLAVTRRQWRGRLNAVLGSQVQHRLAGDLQAFQDAFGGELLGEERDLLSLSYLPSVGPSWSFVRSADPGFWVWL
ncbi:hypothetical protein [Streptomyces sp. NPDC002588]|uniref:hypothetical protein n=1 Tax=Streptomyces sp. NPDC002588 TaxID=3154419 RepID=UPI00331C653A